ncbi:conserved hypothetical protein [Beutenbergia cavernae DSM 12333]|uniref:Type VII secretion protein EccE n=1 Tax=Beutenbergia cavernae (strain ATCC BAA-8 / DSM 12333 / CCUG 43141 / JCM 11478 / NBRC 16432 / NCIMB 13614 / HKI 0122) TaxID=471853 RepID=C5C0P4_BEUC1|nr:hypothetical protein [Beutenbergia cavernae]ACQ81440.1 conserved hypothetical protein [Beutenbergia cavernae DSM 12333]
MTDPSAPGAVLRRRGVLTVVALVAGMLVVGLGLPRVLAGVPAPWPGVLTALALLGVLVAVAVPYGRSVARTRAAEQAVVTAERPEWAREQGWSFAPESAPAPSELGTLVLPHVARPGEVRDVLFGRIGARDVVVASLTAKVPQRAGGAAVLDAAVELVSVTTRRRLPVVAVTDGKWPEPRWRAPAAVANVAESNRVPGLPAGLVARLDAGAEAVLPAIAPIVAQLAGTRDAVVVSADRVTVYGLEGRGRVDGERRLASALAVADAAEAALGGPVV